MIKFTLVLISVLACSFASADSSYYCNGNFKQYGETWYYPNGNFAQYGSTIYYPNGNFLRYGSTLYYPDGKFIQYGDTLYHQNGNFLKYGSTYYYSNGNFLKYGSTCYYSNRNSMGTCPRRHSVDLGQGMRATLDLSEGIITEIAYETTIANGSVVLYVTGQGDMLDISYSCSN
jgi:hypothetical protein